MKKGFTLVEVLVAIALFSIIVAISAGGFTIALRTQRQLAALISAQSNVSLAMEQMAREIRTGYLFCHDANNNPTCACANTGTPNSCGIKNGVGNNDLETADINFFNANGANVVYSLGAGTNALMRSDSGTGGISQAITGDTVTVKYLKFVIQGNDEGDNLPPRITILLGVAPSSSDPAIANDVLSLQTTVSARVIDCSTVGGVTSC